MRAPETRDIGTTARLLRMELGAFNRREVNGAIIKELDQTPANRKNAAGYVAGATVQDSRLDDAT